MPLSFAPAAAAPTDPSATRKVGGLVFSGAPPQPTQPAPDESGVPTAVKVAGGAALLGGAAYLGSKLKGAPGILGKIGTVASGANALRQQFMLSGFAPVKSVLGNVGAAINASAEHGSLSPLRELFSGQTLSDAVQSFKTGSGAKINPVGHTTELPKILSLPGRVMGAMDEATQGALRRGGLSAKDAMAETLQTPLTGGIGKAFQDNPVAQFMIPFRRTPFNQLTEGLGTFQGGSGPMKLLGSHPKTQAAYLAAGAVHGAATSDDSAPLSLPMMVAAAGRRGVPYGLAAIVARNMAGGKVDPTLASSLTPISDYGINQTLTDPLSPFRKPAAATALEKLFGK